VSENVDTASISTSDAINDDAFFTADDKGDTVVTRYDFEQTVQRGMKSELTEVDRYWVNKPYAFVSLMHSADDNEVKYYAVEPHLSDEEGSLLVFLSEKLRKAVGRGALTDDDVEAETPQEKRTQIRSKALELLADFDLYTVNTEGGSGSFLDTLRSALGGSTSEPSSKRHSLPDEQLDATAQPSTSRWTEQDPTLTMHQVERLLYYLEREFVGYDAIDPIKNDIAVEDISCDGYNSRVFVYHTDYEQIITNISHGEQSLDDFVIKLAQRSGKGISKRSPQVDATLPDGSRAQLTLGTEVSDHGTNYTIRQFKDVPFTPVDLINWKTFSIDQMAFLWLAIENEKNLLFAGGTASGKTTSLNAVSLFIPSSSKVVSIEDTREVELPQRNWVASVTRPSFSSDDKGDIDEFDLLEASLRQRPDYIVMGEIRGEEGRTAFQVMSTGHTTYTTFHADTVGEVLKRFTTDPINVSKTMFTSLDLVSIQTQTRVDGEKVRRSKTLTEVNRYDPENDEINIRDVYQWNADDDTFDQLGNPETLREIAFDRGWSYERLEKELNQRKLVLAYLISHGLNKYRQVAATIQAFMSDQSSVLSLIAQDALRDELSNLEKMESVSIDVSDEDEEVVPRPDPSTDVKETVSSVLSTHHDLLEEHANTDPVSLETLLNRLEPTTDIGGDSGYELPDEAPQTGVGEESIPQTPDPEGTTVTPPETQAGAATTSEATEPDQEIDFENPLAQAGSGENPIVAAAPRQPPSRGNTGYRRTPAEGDATEESRAEVTADTATVNIGSVSTSEGPLGQPESTDEGESSNPDTSSEESTDGSSSDADTVITRAENSFSPDPTWPSEFSSLIEVVFDENKDANASTDDRTEADSSRQPDSTE